MAHDRPAAGAATIWQVLAERALATPDGLMLVDEHGRRETYASVLAAAERVAAGLAECGVEPGSVVSWQLPTRIDTVVLGFALSRLGVVQNPIIPIYRRREVEAMVRQCGAGWLLVPDTFRGFDHATMAKEIAEDVGPGLRTLVLAGELPEGDPAALPPEPSAPDAVRWIYTTSGTTAAPKGVCHTDAGLVAGGDGLADALGVTSEDVGTIFFPVAHIGGPDMLIVSLRAAMPLVIMEAFTPPAAAALMRENGVTVSGGSTAFYLMFLQEQQASGPERLVPSLRMLSGGGAPLSAQQYRDVTEGLGVALVHGFGMTESPMITSGRYDDDPADLEATSGRPVLGCEVEIRSADGVVLGPEERGQVWIRGSMLFQYYLVEGEQVRPHDEHGWFCTGDLGFRRAGGHVVLVGREKDLIIRKGESISPMEIEEVLAELPAVADVAVIGLADPERGERICAVVQLRPGATAPDVLMLRAHCLAAGLAPNKSPEQVEVVDQLPKTPTMKTLKQQLRARFADDTEDAAPAPPVASGAPADR